MPAAQRVSIEQIVNAYRATGSIWKAAKTLGVCGQSVWERLKAIDYPVASRTWSADELGELRELADSCTIGKIAERLGRPYYAVAIKLSRLGLANRYGNRQKKAPRRGSGLTKKRISDLVKLLKAHPGTLRQFSRMHGAEMETLVHAIQKNDPGFWKEYSIAHTELESARCSYCEIEYYPMTRKQKTCSRKCSADAKRDAEYFGGKRRSCVGLLEGVCQLCLQKKERGLSAHHVLGKEHDPENECLVALCQGCHQIVGRLAGRKFVDTAAGWEDLISLVMARRLADKKTPFAGTYACVEIEYLTEEEVFNLGIVTPEQVAL